MVNVKKVAIGVGLVALPAIILLKQSGEPSPPPLPGDAEINIYGLSISPNEIGTGESVSISFSAQNIGEKKDSFEIVCEILADGIVKKIMRKTVTLLPGEVTPVSFSFTPTTSIEVETTYDVEVGDLHGSFLVIPSDDVPVPEPEPPIPEEPPPPGFTAINYYNPKGTGSTHWEMFIFDIAAQRIIDPMADTQTINEIGVPYMVSPSTPEVLIIFRENRDRFFDDYQYGPFKATLQPDESYSWNAMSNELDGLELVSLPDSDNLTDILAEVVGIDRDTQEMTLRLIEAVTVPGKEPAGSYFIGMEINHVGVSVGDLREWRGKMITAQLRMVRRPLGFQGEFGYKEGWVASDIILEQPEYPDYAYNFEAVMEVTPRCSIPDTEDPDNVGWPGYGVIYSVSGDARWDTFSIVAEVWGPGAEGRPFRNLRMVGPISDAEICAGPELWIELWCHPDPNARYDDDPGWKKPNGWKFVDSIRTPEE